MNKLYELTYDEVKIIDFDFLMSEEEYENELKLPKFIKKKKCEKTEIFDY